MIDRQNSTVHGRVSVIIPSYNRGGYLHQTIASALDQDYPDVEIIVADDASTDNSVEVARSFGDRVRVLQLPHGDISSTRNRGILASTGEFVAFLDCDDVHLRSRISATVAALHEHPEAVLAFCETRLIDGEGNDLGVPQYIKSGYDPASLEALFWSNRVPCLCVTARKQAIIEVGLFDPTYDSGCEDYELWLRLRRRYPFVYVPRELALYRRHTTNTSSQRIFTAIRNERRLVEELAREFPQFRPWLPRRHSQIDLVEGFHRLRRGQYWQSLICCVRGFLHSPCGAAGFALYLVVDVTPKHVRRFVKVRMQKGLDKSKR